MICSCFVTFRPYTQAKNGRETTVPKGWSLWKRNENRLLSKFTAKDVTFLRGEQHEINWTGTVKFVK